MDKKILAAGMQKGFVGVVVAYFLAIALGILAGIWENHYLMIVVQFTSTVRTDAPEIEQRTTI